MHPSLAYLEPTREKKLIMKHPTLKSLSALANKSRIPSMQVQKYNVPLRPLDFTPLTISTLDAARQRGMLNKLLDQAATQTSMEPFQSAMSRSLSITKPRLNKLTLFNPSLGQIPQVKSNMLRSRVTLGKSNSINKEYLPYDNTLPGIGSRNVDIQTNDEAEIKLKPIPRIPFLYSSDQEKKMFYKRIERNLKYEDLMQMTDKNRIYIPLQK